MGDRLNAYKRRASDQEEQQNEQLLHDLDEAYDAWQLALHHFNQAQDPESVDDAIYLLIAAEKRYEGLLRIARRKRLAVAMSGDVTTHPSVIGTSANTEKTASI